MAYTVKQLAEFAKISVRTLHFYDGIGLLKPAYYGDNGYRYYEEEQLLLLQQILFFRELEFPLEEIREILAREDFDRIQALESHRVVIQRNAERMTALIQTIDKTIASLKGETKMDDNEMFAGFDPEKQKEYEDYWAAQGEVEKRLVLESRRRTKNWKKDDFERVRNELDALHRKIAAALKGNLKPDSLDVQELIRKHHLWIENFYTPTKDVYVGLGRLYVENPEFRKTFVSYDPQLAEFMAKAMEVFAHQSL